MPKGETKCVGNFMAVKWPTRFDQTPKYIRVSTDQRPFEGPLFSGNIWCVSASWWYL